MKYPIPKSAKSFHILCKETADILAEEKPHSVTLDNFVNIEIFRAQVRVFLCTCYGFSANGSESLLEKYLTINVNQNSNCLTARI